MGHQKILQGGCSLALACLRDADRQASAKAGPSAGDGALGSGREPALVPMKAVHLSTPRQALCKVQNLPRSLTAAAWGMAQAAACSYVQAESSWCCALTWHPSSCAEAQDTQSARGTSSLWASSHGWQRRSAKGGSWSKCTQKQGWQAMRHDSGASRQCPNKRRDSQQWCSGGRQMPADQPDQLQPPATMQQ